MEEAQLNVLTKTRATFLRGCNAHAGGQQGSRIVTAIWWNWTGAATIPTEPGQSGSLQADPSGNDGGTTR